MIPGAALDMTSGPSIKRCTPDSCVSFIPSSPVFFVLILIVLILLANRDLIDPRCDGLRTNHATMIDIDSSALCYTVCYMFSLGLSWLSYHKLS